MWLLKCFATKITDHHPTAQLFATILATEIFLQSNWQLN